uniref:Uncharacterized protein n=1 Tax=Oryza meridionalis TaxID=40149 RepID=A0A0E0C4I6_9ORYZ
MRNQIWRERREGDEGAVLAAGRPQQVGSPRLGPRQPPLEQPSSPTSPRRRSPSSPPPGLDVTGWDRGPPPAAASPAPRRLAAAGGSTRSAKGGPDPSSPRAGLGSSPSPPPGLVVA